MITHGLHPLAGILAAAALLSPAPVKAVAILITHGDSIAHIGDLPPQIRQNGGPSKVGYKYSYWGVFWINLWTWGGEYCVYDGDRYAPIQSAQAAELLGKPERSLGVPFLYRVPLGWLIFGPLILLGILAAVYEGRKTNELQKLFKDPKYLKAMEIMQEQYAKQAAPPANADPAAPPEQTPPEQVQPEKEQPEANSHAALEAAVRHLEGEGVPREEAERNLQRMIQALSAPQQS